MRPGWNGNNPYDRFCHRCVCHLWHGHGGYRNAFILDKKMNDYVIDPEGRSFSSSKLAIDWYKKQYYLLLEENKMLQEECAALREHINELQ
jgi:hypothetical protein